MAGEIGWFSPPPAVLARPTPVLPPRIAPPWEPTLFLIPSMASWFRQAPALVPMPQDAGMFKGLSVQPLEPSLFGDCQPMVDSWYVPPPRLLPAAPKPLAKTAAQQWFPWDLEIPRLDSWLPKPAALLPVIPAVLPTPQGPVLEPTLFEIPDAATWFRQAPPLLVAPTVALSQVFAPEVEWRDLSPPPGGMQWLVPPPQLVFMPPALLPQPSPEVLEIPDAPAVPPSDKAVFDRGARDEDVYPRR